MDPISQGSVGALFSQTISRKEKLLPAAFVGLVAGLSPDLDILIRSSSDPILSLEYHRQFTHALIFIPIGAFIVTFFIQFFVQKYLIWKETYAIALIAYATHGLLDSCTTYGTQLFWPFSNHRVSFSNISIIDPLLTLPIILCILISILKKSKLATYTALLWLIF